jgi:hypothetical protein
MAQCHRAAPGERTNEINLLQNRPRIVAVCRQTAAIFCKTKECGSLPRSRYAGLSGLEHLRDEIRPAICGRLTCPRELLFGQHQGRGGPVCGSGEGDLEIFRAMNLLQIKRWQPDAECAK